MVSPGKYMGSVLFSRGDNGVTNQKNIYFSNKLCRKDLKNNVEMSFYFFFSKIFYFKNVIHSKSM